MPSPLLEANSTSLGGWVSMVNGVNVAAGEVVSLRLADTAGVKYWSLAITSTDPETGRQGTSPAVTVDPTTHTATFTMPVIPADGVALRFLSIVGVSSIGKDANFVLQDSYRFSTVVCVLAPSGLRVLTTDQTTEGSAAYGWGNELDALLRHPPGTTSVPSGPAGGDLILTFPNPGVGKIHGASVPIAGSLVTGNGLFVSGTSALTYSALNLAGGSGWVSGQLPLVNFAPGSNGQVITTAAGVAAWATLVDANISSSAAIAPSKLGQASATSGQVLTWSGSAWAPATPSVSLAGLAGGGASTGQALIWTGSAWAPGSNFGAQNILTSGTLGAGAGTFTSLTDTGLGLGVVHSSAGGAFTSSLLVNADVSASAAIAGTKISPAFGSQNISTTGTLSAGATTVTGLTDTALGAGVVHSSAGGVLSIALVDLTTEVTGILPAANLPASASTGQIAASLAALALIDTAAFTDTTQCGVITLIDSFTLRKTSARTPDGIKVIAAKSGGGTVGNWERNERPSAAWRAQATWYVDPSAGNDEYDGTASSHGAGFVGPIKTVAELNRRWGYRGLITTEIHVYVLGDMASTDFLRCTAAFDGSGVAFFHSTNVAQYTSGAGFTSVTSLNRATPVAWSVTDTAIPAGTWATAIAGFWRIRITSGPRAGAVAFPILDLGGGAVRTTPFNQPTFTSPMATSPTIVTPQAGDLFVVERMAKAGGNIDIDISAPAVSAGSVGHVVLDGFDGETVGSNQNHVRCSVYAKTIIVGANVDNFNSDIGNSFLVTCRISNSLITGGAILAVYGSWSHGGTSSIQVTGGAQCVLDFDTIGQGIYLVNANRGGTIRIGAAGAFDSTSDGVLAVDAIGVRIEVVASGVCALYGNNNAGVGLKTKNTKVTYPSATKPTITGAGGDTSVGGVIVAWPDIPVVNNANGACIVVAP